MLLERHYGFIETAVDGYRFYPLTLHVLGGKFNEKMILEPGCQGIFL